MAAVIQIAERDEIPAGVLFNRGVWTVSFRAIYLGSYITFEDACKVRRWMEKNRLTTPKGQVKDEFIAATKNGLIPENLKPGSSNSRKPRGISQISKEVVK